MRELEYPNKSEKADRKRETGGERRGENEALITCVNWSPSFSLSLRRQGAVHGCRASQEEGDLE